jgi:hypothetical protein
VASRYRSHEQLRKLTIPLMTGAVIGRNGPVGVPFGTFTAGPASGATNERNLGLAIESVDQTAGDTRVQVALSAPVALEYAGNDPDSAIVLSTDFLKKVYWHPSGYVTLTKTAGGVNYVFAGTVYTVDAKSGVGFKPAATDVADLLS